MATEATTGMTLMPAAFQAFMYLVGLPAPVTTTGTCSSMTTWATSSANGLMSMTFTPKGLSVFSRSSWIWSRSQSALAFMAAMMPRPPASLTAPARLAFAMRAMAPWMMGASMPRSSVTLVFIPMNPFAVARVRPCPRGAECMWCAVPILMSSALYVRCDARCDDVR